MSERNCDRDGKGKEIRELFVCYLFNWLINLEFISWKIFDDTTRYLAESRPTESSIKVPLHSYKERMLCNVHRAVVVFFSVIRLKVK